MKGRFPLAVLLGAALVLAACDGSDIVTPSIESSRNVDNDCTTEDDCTGGEDNGEGGIASFSYWTKVEVWAYSATKVQIFESVSKAIDRVASSRVSASYYVELYCHPTRRSFLESQSSPTVYGSPNIAKVSKGFSYIIEVQRAYEARSTHVFTASPGATGGGTFYSSKYQCF
ncbi:MAG TPA: hypothetical protein VHG28_15420 [Longimicrobiaceae bacterium]|nr:hypothetical protein [Longimicrobiaceae bacterium]